MLEDVISDEACRVVLRADVITLTLTPEGSVDYICRQRDYYWDCLLHMHVSAILNNLNNKNWFYTIGALFSLYTLILGNRCDWSGDN